MSKAMVAASQKKRRISKDERESIDQSERTINKKLQWKEVKPPSHLGRKEKALFKKYVENMRELEVLSVLDTDILAHYVIFQATFNELQEKVKETGLVMADGKPNPLLAEMRQISKTVYTYQNKLGLNPSDRLRFRKIETEEIDELTEFQDEL